MVIKLPEFKGYTVDVRLRQFRKVDRSKPNIEFVDFDSEKGKELLNEIKEEEISLNDLAMLNSFLDKIKSKAQQDFINLSKS